METQKELIKRVRQIRNLNLRMGLPYYPDIENYAIGLSKQVRKKLPLNASILGLAALSDVVAKEFQRAKAFEETGALINAYAGKQEKQAKQDLLEELRKEGERKSDGALGSEIFFLCSSHKDVAEDHKDYQGKLYYDRFWRRYVKDAQTRKMVEAFISEKNLKSMQWVINKPVWLITRPNCRHYFSKVSIKEALSKPIEEILDERGMIREVGLRDSGQTIRHSTLAKWYSENNVKALIRTYQDRLTYHLNLAKAQNNPALQGYIDKDKRLIAKWKAYLNAKIH